MNYKKFAIFNAISLAIHIATSYFTQLKLINSTDVGQVSDRYPSLFTPAGFTFSIWGLIYLALVSLCVYHLICAYKKSQSHPANLDLSGIGWRFVVNNIATTLWLIAWTNEMMIASAILIIVQLITLIQMHRRLFIHDATRELPSKVFTQFPLSIYFGWITIATIANIATVLTARSWDGWGVSDINWTMTMVAIAVLLTIWVMNRRRNVVYGLVIIWGIFGILSKRKSVDSSEYEPIIYVCYGGMVMIGIACLFTLVRNLRIRKIPLASSES